MNNDNNNKSVTAVTPGEAITWTAMVLTTLPHQQWGLGVFYGLGALVCWGLRRQPEIRALTETALEVMEQNGTPKLLSWVVGRIPVPPADAPRNKLLEVQHKRSQTLEARPSGKEKLNLGKGLTGLLGDDNPLNRKKDEPAKIDRATGADTKANKAIVAAYPPSKGGAVDDWIKAKMEQSEIKVLRLQDVVDLLNEDIDDNPMILIVGNSGTGKTVLAQLLVGTRPGKVVVLDQKRPKGWEGPKWGGLPYVSRDSDGGFSSMEKALAAVVEEMNSRYQRQETATAPFQQLTVVFDEAKNTLEEAPELANYYRRIVSIGREVGVRLILISTTDRARKLGFDGEADSLDSFTWVRLGEFATKVLPDVADRGTERYYHAVVRKAGQYTAFENELAYTLVRDKLVLKPTKAWAGVKYNCQLLEDKKTEVNVRPLASSVSAPEFNLLESLLSEERVKPGQKTPPLEAKAEAADINTSADSVRKLPLPEEKVTSATREVAKLRLQELTRKWKEAAEVDRRLALNALREVQQGKSVTSAVEASWGSGGGRKFAERSSLVRAAVEMAELVCQLKSSTRGRS